MTGFMALVRRDVTLALKRRNDALMAVMFFVVTVSLFPLGVGPAPQTLARIASGVVWVAALLAVLLSLDRLFDSDFEDGGLDLLALSPLSLPVVVLAKVLAHWLSTGLPLIAVSPVLALVLNMDPGGLWALLAALALGTPTLSLVGAVGAALSLGARRGSVLLSLLVLPLYIPVLIFGVSAVDTAIFGISARPQLLILGALALTALVLTPWATAAAVRAALD